jgi:hypothetical protein
MTHIIEKWMVADIHGEHGRDLVAKLLAGAGVPVREVEYENENGRQVGFEVDDLTWEAFHLVWMDDERAHMKTLYTGRDAEGHASAMRE